VRLPGGRRFAPSAWATLAAAAGVALCAFLGTWQLGRADDKRAQLAAFAAATTPVPLPRAAQPPPRYAHVRVAGHFLPERQFLLDNMTHAAVAGFRVLTPFLTDDGDTLIVDRGWLPMGPSRDALPRIDVDAAPRMLQGRSDALPRPGIEPPAAPPAERWPRIVAFPKLADLERALGRPLYPAVLLLDPAEPDGYLRDWRPGGLPPERHVGYAVQWYALGATLVVAFVIASLKAPS
jgi:surfeit locus 1 family protein